MKAHLQKFMATAVLGLALFSISIPAWAGSQSAPEVEIKYDAHATGSMAGARFSSDSQQYIGCHILGTTDSVTCLARDKTGESLACYFNHSKGKPPVMAMTDFSYIHFALKERGSSVCGELEVTNSSEYLR